MFSARIPWDSGSNRLTRVLESRRRAGHPVLDLTESNPTRSGLEYPAETILSVLARPESLFYEPQPAGLESARKAVASYYAEQGVPVEAAQVLLTCSTSESYAHLFRLLGNPGDSFLVPHPSYPLFAHLAGLEGVVLQPYPLIRHEAEWNLDLHSLEQGIGPESRAILLVHPNNPTGSFIKQHERDQLLAICRRHRLALVIDEVFSDYSLEEKGPAVKTFAAESEVPCFVLNGLSKISGLPQVKLGWIVVAGPAELGRRALEHLELIADTFLSVGTPVQQAAGALLEVRRQIQPQILARLRCNLSILRQRLSGTPAQLLPPEGGWYAVLRLPRTRDDEEWALALLEEQGVLVHPGYFFDFPDGPYLVCSLLTPSEILDEGIQRLTRFWGTG